VLRWCTVQSELQLLITSWCISVPEIVKLGQQLSPAACEGASADRWTADSALGEALHLGVPGVMGLRLVLDVGARRTGGCIRAMSEQSIFMVGEAARDESTELFAERAASAPLLPSCAEMELLSAFTFCMVRSRLLSFRNGQRVIPCARQIFFSDVRHMPICCATCFSGR